MEAFTTSTLLSVRTASETALMDWAVTRPHTIPRFSPVLPELWFVFGVSRGRSGSTLTTKKLSMSVLLSCFVTIPPSYYRSFFSCSDTYTLYLFLFSYLFRFHCYLSFHLFLLFLLYSVGVPESCQYILSAIEGKLVVIRCLY